MVAGLLQIIWNSRPTTAGGGVPRHEFFGSRLMKAIFHPRCNKFRQKTADSLIQWRLASSCPHRHFPGCFDFI
jgi:hypothetical protein